jgi:hypothetical protein
VVVVITGVVKFIPDPRITPPASDEYQLMIPPEDEAPKVTVPLPHILAGVVPVIAGIEFTVTVTIVLEELEQPAVFKDSA